MPVAETIEKRVDTNELCEMFGVTPMSIARWRIDKALPTIKITGRKGSRAAIRFDVEKVTAWAKKNGIKIVKRLK